jgi:excinuclease UvrABC ATPase subunit
MVTTGLATDDVINVHLTLICTTQLAHTTITLEHTLSLFAVASAIQFI